MNARGPRQDEPTNLDELASTARLYTQDDGGSTSFITAIEGLSILRSDRAEQPAQCLIRPGIYMTLQGAKWATFGKKSHDFPAGQALVVTVHLPARGTVSVATPEEPYLGLVIELDRAIMQQVAEEIGMHLKAPSEAKARGSFVLTLNRQLVDCALRAVRLLETPEAIPTLYPGIMREVCYWLLTGAGGDQINHIMLMANGHERKIIEVIHDLRARFREAINVEDLALAANMSPATFHRQFKSVTAMAPQQYQQQLRLHEARRLLIFSNATVETAASEVGYSSVSQFSREYTRMFGNSPRRDAASWRASKATVKGSPS